MKKLTGKISLFLLIFVCGAFFAAAPAKSGNIEKNSPIGAYYYFNRDYIQYGHVNYFLLSNNTRVKLCDKLYEYIKYLALVSHEVSYDQYKAIIESPRTAKGLIDSALCEGDPNMQQFLNVVFKAEYGRWDWRSVPTVNDYTRLNNKAVCLHLTNGSDWYTVYQGGRWRLSIDEKL